MPMKIPFYRYSFIYKLYHKKLLKIIHKTASAGKFIMQNDLVKFENEVARLTNAKYCVGVSNATDGLQMLLMASGIKKNDEILMSTHTMIATASATFFAGAKPKLLDINDKDFLIDENKLEKSISKKTKAIIVTQLNGRIANMKKIVSIAKKNNLMIFEDSAQALGAKYRNKFAGTFGKGGVFSFYPAKILGCFGDGGAVITNDKKIFEKLLLLRDHGRSLVNGKVETWGFNARLDNIEAAILSFLIRKLPFFIKKRREIASIYNVELKNLKQLSLPPAPLNLGENYDTFQNYEVMADQRDKLAVYLKNKNIGTLKQWTGYALHDFKKLNIGKVSKNTKKIFNKLLLLPMNISLTKKEVMYICYNIKKYYSDSK
jgi:dTDP-4-amino-4,6-dideoxygalactose transaminase